MPAASAVAGAASEAESARSGAGAGLASGAVGGVYSPGGWATLHRGPANRKLVGRVPLAETYASWNVLAGASILTAPTMSPDGRRLYVTTGRARGSSNLHAYSIDGEWLWRSEPWTSARDGVDPCAILSSPIVDRAGDVFIGDCNQLFAFGGDGTLRWVVDLPAPRPEDWKASEALPINALTTAVFTREGDVMGVTNFGDVVVYDRATGRRLNRPMRLPGHVPSASSVSPRPESVFGEGLIDPEIREWAWQLLVGGAMPSANTPGVDLETGRIFVAATAPTVGRGALYGLDLPTREAGAEGAGGERHVEVEIAFATEMGPGSGSSPSLSPDARTVYVSDEHGRFYGVDARAGAIRWEVETRAASAAAAVGANGDIYALQAFGPALIAISEAGEVRWESDLSELTAEALPEGFWLGEPVAFGNGNPTVLGDVVVVPVVYGYETTLFGRRVPWPVLSAVVAVDAETGVGVRNLLWLEDDSTGITSVLPDGRFLNSLGTAMTSGVRPLAAVADWLLPGDLEPLLPVGGLQVSRPVGGRLDLDPNLDADPTSRPAPAASGGPAAAALGQRLALRDATDREADRRRRPAEMLAFAGIEEGMHVADLMAGAGWYTEVLARAVGSRGRVVAQNNRISAGRYGEALAVRLEGGRLPQVSIALAELDALDWEPGTFDAAFMVDFYHDTVWMGVDRPEMNRRIHAALEPGGVFLVIDHAARAGDGTRETKTLHRIEASTVVAEIEAAGFRLTGRSPLLANADDDRRENVFSPSIRGRTDRFVLRFEKPGTTDD